jgi:anti-anti-sigma factor
MLDVMIEETGGATWVRIKGRIDGMTAPELEKKIEERVLAGARMLVADLHEVEYVSSAGLRTFLTVQKSLKGAGGEIIIFQSTDIAEDVFELSGFKRLFSFAREMDEIQSLLRHDTASSSVREVEWDGPSFQCMDLEADPGDVVPIGSKDKLALSQYTETDVETVRAGDIRFGGGLAAIGDQYADYGSFFGEAVVLEKSLFFYPAVKQPAVDFMLCPKEVVDLSYRFLHGFRFSGSFRYILSFDGEPAPVALPELVRAGFHVSSADGLGLVILGESRGIWGMHLRRVPAIENRPENGESIFDASNFMTWFNFPVDPSDTYAVVAGAGVAARDAGRVPPPLQPILPEENATVVNGAVFSKSPLSRRIEQFESELDRVLKELEAIKVQRLMDKSQFGSCMVGIVEFDG